MLPVLQGAESGEAAGLVAEASATVASLEAALAAWKLTALLGGPYDAGGAVVSIQVNAQPTFNSHILDQASKVKHWQHDS